MSVRQIYLQTINCSNIDQSLAFYTEVFEFVHVDKGEISREGAADLSHRALPARFGLDADSVEFREEFLSESNPTPTSTYLHLFEWISPKAVGEAAYPSPNHIGLVRTQFTVDNFEEVRDRLLERGTKLITDQFEWLAFGTGENPPKRTRTLVAVDPDGVMLQVKEG